MKQWKLTPPQLWETPKRKFLGVWNGARSARWVGPGRAETRAA
jgi:hypothetical protein